MFGESWLKRSVRARKTAKATSFANLCNSELCAEKAFLFRKAASRKEQGTHERIAAYDRFKSFALYPSLA